MKSIKHLIFLISLFASVAASASFFNRSTPNEMIFPLDTQGLITAAEMNVGYLMPSGCPGTLITPTKIIVASHCIDNHNQDYYQPSELTFLYGNTLERALYIPVARLIPARLPQRPPPHDTWGKSLGYQTVDIAVVELAEPARMNIKIEIGINSEDVLTGRYTHVGFPILDPATNSEQVLLIDHCEVKDLFHSYIYNNNCSFAGGSSGGPMFVVKNNKVYLAGIATGDKSRNTPSTRRDYTPEGASYGLMLLNDLTYTKYLQKLVTDQRVQDSTAVSTTK